MITINPYLNFKGNTEEAFNFSRSVFGGEFSMVIRYKDMEPENEYPEKIMHIALPVGNGNLIMGTDALGKMGDDLVAGNNFFITINAQTKDETDIVFNALAVGGTVAVPVYKAEWGAYFGMLTDQFGIQWLVDCPL